MELKRTERPAPTGPAFLLPTSYVRTMDDVGRRPYALALLRLFLEVREHGACITHCKGI